MEDTGEYKEMLYERNFMGKINSKAKGSAGERELSHILSEYGYEVRRGQQYCGANGDADCIGLPGIHIECKRAERLNIYDAMAQAKSDAKDDEIPAVFHRRNHDEWKVTLRLSDFMKIYREWECGNV